MFHGCGLPETFVDNMFKIKHHKNKVLCSINFDTINYIKNKIYFCLVSTKRKIKRSYTSHQSLKI